MSNNKENDMKTLQPCNAVEHTVSENGRSCLCGYFNHNKLSDEALKTALFPFAWGVKDDVLHRANRNIEQRTTEELVNMLFDDTKSHIESWLKGEKL